MNFITNVAKNGLQDHGEHTSRIVALNAKNKPRTINQNYSKKGVKLYDDTNCM